MEITTKTNGYEISKELKVMINRFNNAVAKLFGDNVKSIEHFYYGDKLDMLTVKLKNKHYGQFNLSAKRVSFNGHSCSFEEYEKFGLLTYNDELYSGKLLEL